MNDDYRTLMDGFAAETESSREEVDALRTALLGSPSDAAVSRALVSRLPRPARSEVVRVRERIEAHAGRRGWAPWILVIGGSAGAGTLVGAAIALLVVSVATGALSPERAGAPPAPPAVAGTAPLAVHLAATEAPEVVRPAPGVALRVDGTGEVGGTAQAPRIDWTGGALSVEVTPGQGIALTVVTREAVVRVIGTVFTVDRDALGTRVDVSRGKVEVTCSDGPVHALTAGRTATCLPTTAPGLLARANRLKKDGAPARRILEAVEAALPMASGPFRAELLALQAETLLASGRERQARAAADAYLESGGPRRLEVLQIAASAALAVDGCAAALPYLHALEEAGAGDPAQLARCEEGP